MLLQPAANGASRLSAVSLNGLNGRAVATGQQEVWGCPMHLCLNGLNGRAVATLITARGSRLLRRLNGLNGRAVATVSNVTAAHGERQS